MRHSFKHIVASGWLCAVSLGGTGCEPKRIPPMSVTELMEDRVTLDGVLMKCNQNPAKARNDSDCLNARVAIERLAKDVDPADVAKREAEFERSREQLRLAQEKVRQDAEAKAKVDAYNMPMVPVEGAAQNTAPVNGVATPGVATPGGSTPGGSPPLASRPKL